jgi:hypothetical protein
MKFFIPAENDATKAEALYDSIRKFSTDQMGAKLSARRIYSVAGTHNGKRFTATVWGTFERLGELVIAILLDESRDLYFICTPNRGVLRGEPYLSGSNEIDHVEDFEVIQVQ